MVPDLDETRLRMIWQHHVRPLLEEHFAGQAAKWQLMTSINSSMAVRVVKLAGSE